MMIGRAIYWLGLIIAPQTEDGEEAAGTGNNTQSALGTRFGNFSAQRAAREARSVDEGAVNIGTTSDTFVKNASRPLV